MNESYNIGMSHATHEWVMSHVNESCPIWRSHVAYEWVMSHVNESCSIWLICAAHEHVECVTELNFGTCSRRVAVRCCIALRLNLNVMSHVWVMSHLNKSCLVWISPGTYEWVMSHVNVSCHIPSRLNLNELCLMWMSHVTYEWVMSHVNESCHMWMSHVSCEWVMSHVNESCHIWMRSCLIWMRYVTHEWDMSHMCISRVEKEWAMWIRHDKKGMSHVPYACGMPILNELCLIWISYVKNNESCPICMWHVLLVMSHYLCLISYVSRS